MNTLPPWTAQTGDNMMKGVMVVAFYHFGHILGLIVVLSITAPCFETKRDEYYGVIISGAIK